MKRLINVFFVLVMAATLVGCAAKTSETPQAAVSEQLAKFRVAMVFPGAINDQSWNQSGYDGLKRIEKDLGAEIAYRESVPLTDVEEVLRTFASNDYDLVIGHGDQFSEASKVVAAEFPKINFAVVNGLYTADNLASIALFDEQVTYLAGIVAAKESKSGVLGYIGGMEIPAVTRNDYGFEEGAKSVNPDIKVITTYLGSFTDAAKGKEATLAMADQGVDVMYYYVDQAMVGIQEAAKETGIKLIGCMFDQHEIAPDLILTSAVMDTATAVYLTAEKVQKGEFKGGSFLYGLDSGAIDLAPFYDNVSKETEAAVKEAKDEILSGKIVIHRMGE